MNNVVCPHCHHSFELTEAFRHQVEEQILTDIRKQHAVELAVKEKALRESQEQEIKLRKVKNELDEEKRVWELEKIRQMDTEKQKVREKTMEEFQDIFRLKEKEKDMVIEGLKKSLDEAQRKASVGSQQRQGEVLELDLEQHLSQSFRDDEFIAIAKGALGADIRQIVRTPRGTVCGTILWESKRTKNWSQGWIGKLKSDGLRDGADLLAIVSDALPESVTHIGQHEGVHLCSTASVIPLATLLRKLLIEVTRQKKIGENQTDKAHQLYTYITSRDFSSRIENIINIYQQMQDSLNRERTAYEKMWKQRESQINQLLNGVGGIYGYLQGVAGPSLPSVPGLELPDS